MVVVVALVETHAAALVEGEGRVGRRAKSFGRRGHGIGQRQPEVQELAALEKDRATQARYVQAEAPYGEAGPRSPGARRLRPGGVSQRDIVTVRAQAVLELGELPGARRQLRHEAPDLGRGTGRFVARDGALARLRAPVLGARRGGPRASLSGSCARRSRDRCGTAPRTAPCRPAARDRAGAPRERARRA